MEKWVSCLNGREVPPFVRKRGEVWEPLLLAFPVELHCLITESLTVTDVKNLVLAGSAHFNAILQLRGGITSLHLVSTHNCSLEQQVPSSLFGSFTRLTKFVVDLLTHYAIAPDWKISMLPPSLTHLHVHQRCSISPFLKTTLKDIWAADKNSGPRLTDEYLSQRLYWSSIHTKLLVWFQVGELFPMLNYLAILGEFVAGSSPHLFIGSLPATLKTLHAPFISHAANPASPPAWDSLPAHITSLHCRALSPASLQPLPTRITRLRLTFRREYISINLLKTWTWLTDLACARIEFPGDSAEAGYKLIPPSLHSLELEGITGAVEKAFADLPSTITSLTLHELPGLFRNIDHIKQPLQHLALLSTHIWKRSDWYVFPRTLRSLVVATIDEWPFDDRMPPLIESISTVRGEFNDYDIKKLPSLTRLQLRTWNLSGLIVPPNAVTVDAALLKRTLLHHPFVNSRYIRLIRVLPLTNLPRACERLENVGLSRSIPYAQLPRSLLNLPKSYFVRDTNLAALEDLPQSLTKLSVEGPMRFRRWLALPSSVTTVRRGIVTFMEEDILAFAHHLADKEASGDPVTHVSVPSMVYAPAIASLASKAQRIPRLAEIIAEKPWVALWSPEHFALLPDSVSSLSILPAPPSEQLTWLNTDSRSSSERNPLEGTSMPSNVAIKFPSSLTSLTLGEDVWKHESTSKRKRAYYKLSTCFILPTCGVSLAGLPPTLNRLELFGSVLLLDLKPIQALTSLDTLAIGAIFEGPSNDFLAFIRELPASLRTFRILRTCEPSIAIVNSTPLECEQLEERLSGATSCLPHGRLTSSLNGRTRPIYYAPRRILTSHPLVHIPSPPSSDDDEEEDEEDENDEADDANHQPYIWELGAPPRALNSSLLTDRDPHAFNFIILTAITVAIQRRVLPSSPASSALPFCFELELDHYYHSLYDVMVEKVTKTLPYSYAEDAEQLHFEETDCMTLHFEPSFDLATHGPRPLKYSVYASHRRTRAEMDWVVSMVNLSSRLYGVGELPLPLILSVWKGETLPTSVTLTASLGALEAIKLLLISNGPPQAQLSPMGREPIETDCLREHYLNARANLLLTLPTKPLRLNRVSPWESIHLYVSRPFTIAELIEHLHLHHLIELSAVFIAKEGLRIRTPRKVPGAPPTINAPILTLAYFTSKVWPPDTTASVLDLGIEGTDANGKRLKPLNVILHFTD